jgi:hypothetical protein
MSDQRAQALREQHLSFLGVQHPVGTSSADDPRWPRRLDSLLPNSHPAKNTRWAASFSEYTMNLTPPHHLPITNPSNPTTRSQTAELAQRALTQLRYDDTYDPDSLQIIFSDHGQECTNHSANGSSLPPMPAPTNAATPSIEHSSSASSANGTPSPSGTPRKI